MYGNVRAVMDIFILSIFLFINVRCDIGDAVGEEISCSCHYHGEGCKISVAPPAGYKCKCSYDGHWTCSGTAYSCAGTEPCPADAVNYCACMVGGGNCSGYDYPQTCEATDSVDATEDVALRKADCSCDKKKRGCVIGNAAPAGYKCKCTNYLVTCGGGAKSCGHNEICPGGDNSYCACTQGGGNCNGYQSKPQCPSPFYSQTCNCNKAEDWIKGSYFAKVVEFDAENASINNVPVVLDKKIIPNNTGKDQSIGVEVEKTVSHMLSFSYTSGVKIQSGFSFQAGIPKIAGINLSLGATEEYSFTYGVAKEIQWTIKNIFKCTGAPHRVTNCEIFMDRAEITLPYTMILTHKIVPNCECPSTGVWKAILFYNVKLRANEIGECNSLDCRRGLSPSA